MISLSWRALWSAVRPSFVVSVLPAGAMGRCKSNFVPDGFLDGDGFRDGDGFSNGFLF